ncbi:MAG: metallophosphoesterase [Pseudomonadota bacterium]
MANTNAPRKLLVFTDLHLVNEGEQIIGIDPFMRFAEGLHHALSQHPDAVGILIMGDLTHQGRTAQFQRLKAKLDGLPLPVTLMLGNHDNRAVFRKVFPDAPVTSAGHVQTMQELGDTVLITLDTMDATVTPAHSGILCADRLAWLERALTWADGRQALVAMHHPPVMTGFPGMDGIALQNPEPFRQMLRTYPGPVHVLCGHVHRTISGCAAGLPFTILKSTCHQQPMMLGAADTDHSVDEPGAYGIVLAGPDGIIVHSEDFATAAAATPLRDPFSG